MAEWHHVSILDNFTDLDDPKVERTRRHRLVDIIAIAICATICGADSWVHICWVLLASGRFAVSQTIIPEAQEHFLTLQHTATLISWTFPHVTLREEQVGMVPNLPGAARGHPIPRHHRRCFCPSGPRTVPELLRGLDPSHRRTAARGGSRH